MEKTSAEKKKKSGGDKSKSKNRGASKKRVAKEEPDGEQDGILGF